MIILTKYRNEKVRGNVNVKYQSEEQDCFCLWVQWTKFRPSLSLSVSPCICMYVIYAYILHICTYVYCIQVFTTCILNIWVHYLITYMYMCDVYILCVCMYIVIAYVHICMYIYVYPYVYILRNCEKYNVKRRTELCEGPQPPCLFPLPAFLFPTLCSPRTWTNWQITSLAGGALKDMSLELSGWHQQQWSEKEPGKRIISNHSSHKISSGWKSLPEPNHKVAYSLLLLVTRIHSGRCLVLRCSSVGFSWIKTLSSI